MRISKTHKISLLLFFLGLSLIPIGFITNIFPVVDEKDTLFGILYLFLAMLFSVIGSYGMNLCSHELIGD